MLTESMPILKEIILNVWHIECVFPWSDKDGKMMNILQPVDVRQIQDKFPEKSDGLKELYSKGPQDAFFLVKFWADLNTEISDEASSFYGVTTKWVVQIVKVKVQGNFMKLLNSDSLKKQKLGQTDCLGRICNHSQLLSVGTTIRSILANSLAEP